MIQGTNNFVWIKRDEAKKEASGMILPTSAQTKPHEGEIVSCGTLVQDKKIKAGKRCLWHQSGGTEITYEAVTYVVIESERILGVL